MPDTPKEFIQKYKDDLNILKVARDNAYAYLTSVEDSARKASNIARDQLITLKDKIKTLDNSIYRLESMINDFEKLHKGEL